MRSEELVNDFKIMAVAADNSSVHFTFVQKLLAKCGRENTKNVSCAKVNPLRAFFRVFQDSGMVEFKERVSVPACLFVQFRKIEFHICSYFSKYSGNSFSNSGISPYKRDK